MPSPYRSSATIILAFLLHSASFASSQTTVSPNYASQSPVTYQEYNFTYPAETDDQIVLTSYKDSINVSWTSIAPHHPPTLSIECWIRNATTSPFYASREPDFFFNITTSVPANESSFLVDLVTFQEYSPCNFILEDVQFNYSAISGLTKNNVYAAFSNPFAITVQNHSAGVTWSAENPAPEQNGTDGIGGVTSKSVAGQIVPMAHASLIGAILIALMA